MEFYLIVYAMCTTIHRKNSRLTGWMAASKYGLGTFCLNFGSSSSSRSIRSFSFVLSISPISAPFGELWYSMARECLTVWIAHCRNRTAGLPSQAVPDRKEESDKRKRLWDRGVELRPFFANHTDPHRLGLSYPMPFLPSSTSTFSLSSSLLGFCTNPNCSARSKTI